MEVRKELLIFSFLFLLAGLGLGRYVLAPGPASIQKADYTRASIKAEILAENEALIKRLKSYVETKEIDQRCAQSDEVMSSVIKLFLASLGAKIDYAKHFSPKGREAALAELKNACTEALKRTGPEVYLSPTDEQPMGGQNEEQIAVIESNLKETTKKLFKKPKLKSDKQKLQWFGFRDKNRKVFNSIAQDIKNELWALSPYSGDLKDYPDRFENPYVGEKSGLYRSAKGDESKMSIEIEEIKIKGKRHFKISLAGEGGQIINGVYRVRHPSGHSNGSNGPCRGLVLEQSNKELTNDTIHLIKVPSFEEGFFGRIYFASTFKGKPERLHGSFVVFKDKAQLKKAFATPIRGYW